MPRSRKSNVRSATSADTALGEKIRTRRITAKMSQQELGDHLGVSFQQVQKYEKGVNRVGAARLEQIASALGEDVTYFIGGGPISKAGQEMQTLMTDPLNLRICRALASMESQAIRFQFVRLLESVSGITEAA